jgi:hypothetical protein
MTGWKFAFVRGGYAFLRMSEKGRASFFEKKEAKKLLLLGALARCCHSPRLAKVFCFFFSKKKRLLS